MLNSITLIGSSSGRNAGDAAILSGMMDSIDRSSGRRLLYEIPTYRPEFVWNSYQNRVRPITMLPWHGSAGMLGAQTYLSMRRTNCTLIFDNMLFDRALYNPLFNFMSTMRLFLPSIKRAGKILGCYDIGAGPVSTTAGRRMLGEIGQLMDFITVREQDSYDLLRELGVNVPMIITADAAISVAPAPSTRVDQIMQNLGLSEEREILAINVNAYLNSWSDDRSKPLTRDEFSTIYAKALDRVASELGVPLLFVCTQHHDVAVTREVMLKMTSPIRKILFTNEMHSHHEVKGVLGRVSLLFAMRLHASILCSSAGTPIAGLAFQKKVTSYYRVLGIEASAMSFKDFSEDNIKEHILKCWRNREATRKLLSTRIPELVREADKAAEVVALIDAGKAPAEAVSMVEQGAQSPKLVALS